LKQKLKAGCAKYILSASENIIPCVLKLIRTYGSQRKREEILAKIGKEYKQIGL